MAKVNAAPNVTWTLPRDGIKALSYSQVCECIAAVQNLNAWPATKLALEFLILTATRSGEVRGAVWDEIKFQGGETAKTAKAATWIIPASRMKMKKPHRIPLSGRALETLQEAEALRGASGLVFPSMRDKPLSDMTLSKLVKELGFDAHVHGFRTSFKTWAQEQTNFPNEVSEAALAHVIKNKAEAAYARSDMFEKRRKMMESWSSYLQARGGEVVALGKK